MIITNPEVSLLYQNALEKEYLTQSSTQAIIAYSGKYTGRCPESKRIVHTKHTDLIWWGEVNRPITSELFEIYANHAKNILQDSTNECTYRIDGYAGWDDKYRQKVTVYCQESYHALFMKNMLVEINDSNQDISDFTIYNMGKYNLQHIPVSEEIKDPTLSDTLIALNFETREMIIYGTRYAGEMKKGLLTWMMYYSQLNRQLCLHSSANKSGSDVSLFFGMSGTGKTTLSADPQRTLIGDDEHVWTDEGIFNIEGGCYAKSINLSRDQEPEIYDAIRYGSVLENVVVDKDGNVDFSDDTITQNTRCSYPLRYIPNSLCKNMGTGQHPSRIIFLTCDVLCVLPAISKLSLDDAIMFFLSGYTSKTAGTEQGVHEPMLTFSACFGEPFIVWNPNEYGELLRQKIMQHDVPVWLINTGWCKNDKDGECKRIPLKHTRTMVNFIHQFDPRQIEYTNHHVDYLQQFDFFIPNHNYLNSIPRYILYPYKSWEPNVWSDKITHLRKKFDENWKQKIAKSCI